MADVHEAGKEDDRQGRAVVFNELAHVALEQAALAHDPAAVGEDEHQQRHHDG